jgi:hypothetical protein
MHQTADTSFPARRGLGFGLRLVLVVGFGVARLDVLVGGVAVGTTVVFERDLLAVAVLTLLLGRSATALASRASLRSRLLRWSLFSLGFID